MAAELVHAHEWDTSDSQYFLGLGLGREEVSLFRFSGTSSNAQRVSGFDTEDVVRTWAYNREKPGRVGYGLNSGAVHVKDILGSGFDDASGTAGSGGTKTSATIKHRATRKCNSISFNSENCICSGYERTRGMESLLLWDLGGDLHTPLSSVPITDTIASTQFVPSNPSSLLFGSARTIKEYDTRSNSFSASVSTTMFLKIFINPLNDSSFASCGDTAHISIWDRRMLRLGPSHSEPLLTIPRVFSDNQKFDARCFRWSLATESELAVLIDGSSVRRWETSVMLKNPTQQQSSQLTSGLNLQKDELDEETNSMSGSSDGGNQSNNNLDEQIDVKAVDASYNADIVDLTNSSLFVNKVYDTRTESDKVASFDYCRNLETGGMQLVCLRQSGNVYKMPIRGSPLNIYVDPFNDFKMVADSNELIETAGVDHSQVSAINLSGDLKDTNRRIIQVGNEEGAEDKLKKQTSTLSESSAALSESESDDEFLEERSTKSGSASSYGSLVGQGGEISLSVVLNNDIISTMQRRALAGYSLDPTKNISLLSSTKLNPSAASLSNSAGSGLLAAWKWLNQQQSTSDEGKNYLETPELDLRFIGVYNVWNGLTRETLEPRLSPKARLTNKTVNDAVKYALKKSPRSVYVKADDDLTPYRQLCLRLTGWDFGLSELEPRIEQLEKQGRHEKAAGWAAFHNNVERSVESLANSSKKSLRLMSTAVAGYFVYKDVQHNNIWREQCRRLASELSGPYLRAIFAYISDGSWLDVLDDGSLPLTERLGIALRFLPKNDVGKYISLLTSRAISNGDLEGIILTGLTPKALDLLQAYLDRTSDIQTVCLLVSFGWPRYFEDMRLKKWFEEYRQLLNSWKYFGQRARLDIARSKVGKSVYSSKAEVIQSQAFLRCSHCKENISGTKVSVGSLKWNANTQRRTEPLRQLTNRCVSCNNALPSCGICLLPLGPSLDDEMEFDRWPVFCMQCNHGHHSVHARQWFQKYDICPIPSCPCQCGKTVGISNSLKVDT